jgi:hypothetical protein
MRRQGDDRVTRRGGIGVSLVRPKDEGERWIKLTLITMGI